MPGSSYRKFLSGVLLLLLGSCASQKSITGKKKLTRIFAQSEVFRSHFTGVLIKNVETGEIVLESNSEKNFTPASNTKLLTFYVADKILSDSIPAIRRCTWNDTLYLSGMGDPTLLHPDFPFQPVLNYLQKSSLPVAYSKPTFADEKYGPGWAWDDFPYYFQPEKSALPLYGNCLWVKKANGDSLQIFPRRFDTQIMQDTSFLKMETGRTEEENTFRISYSLLPEKLNESVPFKVNDSLIVDLLQDTLHSNVVVKEASVFCDWQILHSQPKDSVFKKLLVESDNFIAEQLLLSAGAFLFDTLSSEKVIDYAMENYFPDWERQMVWRDGSGLSRYNRISPRFFISLLERIYAENEWERLKTLLPWGGQTGTLKNFLKSSEPFVFAKSGSLTGVYNLSGYIVTDKGNLYTFSLMNNNFIGPTSKVKAEVERLLIEVKQNY